ncbi:MAG: DUF4168 domain-containing protein [Psychroflexus maritimus]
MNRISKILSILSIAVLTTFGAQAQEVTDEQFDKFANAFQAVQQENMKAQQKMVSVIEDEGLSVEKFNEIHQASLNPDAEVEASDEDKKKHKSALQKVEAMNDEIQQMMDAKIKEHGMSVEEFQMINQKVQSDPEMQQKLMQKFQQ